MYHCNHKYILEFLLKMISQIQCFIFDYFNPLYYYVLKLGHVGV